VITLLADTNALRHEGLEQFLAASRDHSIALSDLTLVEMRKSNALRTSRESLRLVANFPGQVFVLRRTHKMLEESIKTASEAEALIDFGETNALLDLARRVRTVPQPAGLAEELEAHERDAQLLIKRLGEEVALLEPGLVEATKAFSAAELKQIRTGKNVERATQRTLLDLLKDTTRDFILRNQEPGRRVPMLLSDSLGTFALRYSLCSLLYYMDWVRIGRQTGKPLQRRINDVVDMQVAAMATYFNGVLSRDRALQHLSNSARGVLRGFGGFVGKDWIVHPDGRGGFADAG
jgi:hypothetical protein